MNNGIQATDQVIHQSYYHALCIAKHFLYLVLEINLISYFEHRKLKYFYSETNVVSGDQ